MIERRAVLAMGLIAGGLMLLELSLTRIFSVTMWYHFAFMAISIAMLGLSAGAVLVHRLGARAGDSVLDRAMPILCSGCAMLAVAGVAAVLRLRFSQLLTLQGILQLALIYVLTTLPFIAGGAAMAIIVRRFASSMSVVYFGDLVGAAIGCVLAIPLIRLLNGPPIVYVTAMALCAAGLILSRRRVLLPALAALIILALWATNGSTGLLRVVWAKQRHEQGILHEAWNSYSRVTVFPTEEAWNTQFFAWGMSPVYDGPVPRQLGMHIDSYAGTPITRFGGNPEELSHLAYDVTALAYHLRPYGTHLVIGPGGGRDILAALALGADSVVAVELNPEVVRAVNDVFGSFSGRPYSLPGVESIVAEARSQLRRETRHFDVIQASLVDTWAATAAGAYTLSENTLYTVEAMQDYLARLNRGGLVSISRFLTEPPGESLRLFAVALEALARTGSRDPAAHVAVVGCRNTATLIASRDPLSVDDVRRIQSIADEMQFSIVSLPGGAHHPLFSEASRRFRDRTFYDGYIFDVRPTTDDRPFFFNMIKPVDFLRVFKLNDLPTQTHGHDAVFILVTVLAIAFFMTVVIVIWPLWGLAREGGRSGVAYSGYFALLGLAFMLAEVTLLQRFVLFLGHPVYSLSVVLLSLLLSGSLGSFATKRVRPGRERRLALWVGLGIAVMLTVARFGLDYPLAHWLGLGKSLRILVTVLLLMPLGLMMGTMLPVGMRRASAWKADAAPWLWGVNGAASVLGSVMAFVLAMNMGFRSTLAVAAFAYASAAILFWFTAAPAPSLDRESDSR
ncbi:MAG: hypothetical protein MUE60_09120 [Candidatus Eisenbacteria bacterium]|jgi:spermidine synthase|nr:hypothetical protein [Candidatus Eisenbacteria bacterium]